MRIDRVFMSVAGVLITVFAMTTFVTVEGSESYAVFKAQLLAFASAFALLGVGGWSWFTFNQGKRGDGDKSSLWNRALAVFGLVVVFVVLLFGLLRT